MFLLLGLRNRNSTIAKGEFFCPRCKAEAAYERVVVKQYFTLYFIPLIPLGKQDDYVKCLECGSQFRPSVLDIARESLEAAAAPWDCADCDNRNPSEYSNCISCGKPRVRR